MTMRATAKLANRRIGEGQLTQGIEIVSAFAA
jgi:hypothetical protein